LILQSLNQLTYSPQLTTNHSRQQILPENTNTHKNFKGVRNICLMITTDSVLLHSTATALSSTKTDILA